LRPPDLPTTCFTRCGIARDHPLADVSRWCSMSSALQNTPSAATVWKNPDHSLPPACRLVRSRPPWPNAASSPTIERWHGPTTLVMSITGRAPGLQFCSAKGCIPCSTTRKTGLHPLQGWPLQKRDSQAEFETTPIEAGPPPFVGPMAEPHYLPPSNSSSPAAPVTRRCADLGDLSCQRGGAGVIDPALTPSCATPERAERPHRGTGDCLTPPRVLAA